MLTGCVGGLIRLGRSAVLADEAKRLREIEEARRRDELRTLSDEVRKEEEQVKNLDGWVSIDNAQCVLTFRLSRFAFDDLHVRSPPVFK
jgi:hypothetical protein